MALSKRAIVGLAALSVLGAGSATVIGVHQMLASKKFEQAVAEKALELQKAGIDHPGFWARAELRGKYGLKPEEIKEFNRVARLLEKHPCRLLFASETRPAGLSGDKKIFDPLKLPRIFPNGASRSRFEAIHEKIRHTPGSFKRIRGEEKFKPFLKAPYSSNEIRVRWRSTKREIRRS